MHLFPNEGHHCAEMLSRRIISAPLMPDEDRNSGGSLRLDRFKSLMTSRENVPLN